MLGGARIVRFVVLQESKITASATAPPVPHNKLSRLLLMHRDSLECHTESEYAQKKKIVTTHFFGPFLTHYQNSTDEPCEQCAGWRDIASATYLKIF